MHEYGLSEEILGRVLAKADEHEATRVLTVRLKIGVLRSVVREHLDFFFDHLSTGTIADGAKIVIEDDFLIIECPSCGNNEESRFLLNCPRCGGDAVSLKGGESLDILSIEIDTK